MLMPTQENLKLFVPSYDPYNKRLPATVDRVGVESDNDLREFREEVRRWNKESAIGFTKEELNLVALILSTDEGNKRFDAAHFIHPKLGGNTAEHPIFIGHQIDKVRDRAAYGPKDFDAQSPHHLAATKLSQKLHGLAAVHDLGELVDISLAEQRAVGAKSKEPEEEALVGPFKLTLAAHAINIGDPMLYVRTIHEMREGLQQEKLRLFKQAAKGDITGDDFVASFGQAIARSIGEVSEHLKLHQQPIPENYAAAVRSLNGMFEEAQNMQTPSSILFVMFDKLEGDAHYRHFVGRPHSSAPVASDAPIHSRLSPNGQMHSYLLASSREVIGSITYAQKSIVQGLAAANQCPEGIEREVATRFARMTAGEILRNHIQLLQKAPAVIDLNDTSSPLELSADPVTQKTNFEQRLAAQKDLTAALKKAALQNPVTLVDSIVDTKTLIAIFEKAAIAIEEGRWTPTKENLPLGFGKLPPELQVTRSEIHAANKKYPLEAASIRI